jgi:hypothetical protein
MNKTFLKAIFIDLNIISIYEIFSIDCFLRFLFLLQYSSLKLNVKKLFHKMLEKFIQLLLGHRI